MSDNTAIPPDAWWCMEIWDEEHCLDRMFFRKEEEQEMYEERWRNENSKLEARIYRVYW